MTATHLGVIETFSPGRTVEVTDNSGITHVIPKTMTSARAMDPATHPRLGTPISILGNTLTLRGYSITILQGEMAEVAYRYGNAVENSNPLAPSQGAPPGRTGTPVTEFFDVDSSLETVSILRHPRYQALSSDDLRILNMMIQAGPLDADGNARRAALSGSDRPNECADKIEAGQISYLAPKYIWRFRKLGTTWVNPYSIGKISSPYGPAPTIDGNWLYMGAQASGWAGGVFEMTHTWESSISGDEWDEHLYR